MTWITGIGIIQYLSQIVDSISISIVDVGMGDVPPCIQEFLPVSESVPICVSIVVIALGIIGCVLASVPAPREINENDG